MSYPAVSSFSSWHRVQEAHSVPTNKPFRVPNNFIPLTSQEYSTQKKVKPDWVRGLTDFKASSTPQLLLHNPCVTDLEISELCCVTTIQHPENSQRGSPALDDYPGQSDLKFLLIFFKLCILKWLLLLKKEESLYCCTQHQINDQNKNRYKETEWWWTK